MRLLSTLAFLLLLPSLLFASDAPDTDGIVVVALRKYLVEGKSNVHLYLYEADGTLKKILTKEPGLDEQDPVFSKDGTSVRFVRKATDPAQAGKEGTFVMTLASQKIRPYNAATDDASFVSGMMEEVEDDTVWDDKTAPNGYASADGTWRLTRQAVKVQGDDGFAYSLATSGGKPVAIASLPGFMPGAQPDGAEAFYFLGKTPFVEAGGFTGCFLRHHLDSTDGNQVWGLNLETRKWSKISQNGALIFHPKDTAGVYVICQSRYEPLGSTGKTVNCTYLDWWNGSFHRIRFSPALSAFDSATVFRGEGDVLLINQGAR